jgi:hypothetical protein
LGLERRSEVGSGETGESARRELVRRVAHWSLKAGDELKLESWRTVYNLDGHIGSAVQVRTSGYMAGVGTISLTLHTRTTPIA